MKKLSITFFILFTLQLKSQDIHFTMFDLMPITINPATTGAFDGDIRAGLNYRSQWGGISKPYKTYSFALDGGILKSKWENGYLGLGVNVIKDVAGTSKLGTTNINLSLSSIVYFDEKNSGSIGLKTSWSQKSLDPSELNWGTQFDGQKYNSSLSSQEAIPFSNVSYFDFSAGGLWSYGRGARTLSSQDEFQMQAGLAYYHINRPSLPAGSEKKDALYSRLTFHSDAFIGMSNSKLGVKPKILIMIQGPSIEILLGTMLRYTLQEKSKYTGSFKGMSIAFGGYYRVGDAFAPSVEFEAANFAIGVAYDMTISSLSTANSGNGGPEIFIRFTNPNPFGTKGSSARFR